MDWGIKIFSNDELRQKFIDEAVQQAKTLGVSLPDKKIKWNKKKKHHDFGKINWSEFNNVISGNGQCNEERIRAKKKAWDDGEWIREAVSEFSKKQKKVVNG